MFFNLKGEHKELNAIRILKHEASHKNMGIFRYMHNCPFYLSHESKNKIPFHETFQIFQSRFRVLFLATQNNLGFWFVAETEMDTKKSQSKNVTGSIQNPVKNGLILIQCRKSIFAYGIGSFFYKEMKGLADGKKGIIKWLSAFRVLPYCPCSNPRRTICCCMQSDASLVLFCLSRYR